jgi:acetyl-CoA carboxylase biotin carboxyl carrier protein
MTPELEQLAALLDTHDLTRLEYEQGDLRIVLERQSASAVPTTAVPVVLPTSLVPTVADQFGSQSAPADASSDAAQPPSSPLITVTAPLVGIAYRSREPGAAPFVEPGQTVAEGDVLCLIEAMKLFNEITAPAAGVVEAVLFEDAALAEYGAPLVTILPATS